ncbi:hypothetical protein XU18_0286 [Perkinsela sp. CCAP 1560/4]|nr:hypothetical protein XU18_0286 [Perkinsela sp. CCAP 1560/4]|eukprot:KNH09601.1 hypothetical protein XU18_0286 [Perkinsela sp. CCAP 1560/4]
MDGGHEWGAYDASEAPSADTTWGLFRVPYTGAFKYLRLIDPFWAGSRMLQLNRSQNLGNWFIWWMHYMVYWWVPWTLLYGDGAPPRDVDWNDEKTGYIC